MLTAKEGRIFENSICKNDASHLGYFHPMIAAVFFFVVRPNERNPNIKITETIAAAAAVVAKLN